jgi:hypothetical protein
MTMDGKNVYSNSEWIITEGIRGPTGDLQSEYHLRGKKAVRHVIKTHKSKRLGGFNLIHRDLQNIRVWIAEIIKMQRTLPPLVKVAGKQKIQGDPHVNEIIKGLFVAVLSIYGKLSPPAKGRGVCLDAAIIKDPAKKKIHEVLLAYRHNFASHSGDERKEDCEVVAAVVNVDGSGYASVLACEISQPSSWGIDYFEKVDALIKDLLDYADVKKNELYDAVKNEELSNDALKSIIELYSKAGVWRRKG